MTTSNRETEARFDPSRDAERFWAMVDGWPGLRREHKESWYALARACPPGSDIYAGTAWSMAELFGVRGASSVARRLAGLERAGLIVRSTSDRYVVRVLCPLDVERPAPAPALRLVGQWVEDRQQTLFPEPDAQPVVAAHPEPVPDAQAEPVPDRAAQAEPVPLARRDCTVYPRTCAGAPVVDVDDDDDVVSTTVVDELEKSEITEGELRDGVAAWRRTAEAWRRSGIAAKPSRQNMAAWLKVFALRQRGRLTEEQWAESLAAVQRAHDGSGLRRGPYAVLWGAWQASIDGFRRQLVSLDLPAGWHELVTGCGERSPPAPARNAEAAAEDAQAVVGDVLAALRGDRGRERER